MSLSRRAILKLGLGAGATPLLGRPEFAAPPADRSAEPFAGRAAVSARCRALPLNRVRLLGGPLKHAQELDARYLLELEPDRMLAYYRTRAGLRPRAEPYAGWDGGGRNLTGHIGGHYLSAVSLMWAATGDARFKDRADYLVAGLKEVQDAHGDGYLSALEGGRRAFGALARGEIRSAAFDLNGEWSPWYTLHKTYAGLRDAYRFAGNRTALDVEVRFAEWAEGILAGLNDDQIQRMLNTEFGGMNEVFVDLYEDTGDERWLRMSYRFEHEAFITPLQRHQDDLAGTHGNTQIPKLIGSADRYLQSGAPADLIAATFFWDRVVQHHTFATGGHGTDEYFGPPDALSGRVDGRTAETCNVYNMLKLTRTLFTLQQDGHYADFHERALFNHILGSIDPEDGSTCYMVPVGRGVQREYQNMQRSFTCCVGSGLESHALHGDGIYYESDDTLWVTIFAPSTAEWEAMGARIAMDTTFPEGDRGRLTVTLGAPRTFTLALRRPHWAGDGFAVRVNGEPVADTGGTEEPAGDGPRVRRQYDYPDRASTFVKLSREWRSGDTVEFVIPKTLRLEPLADDPRRAAVMWGPLVLAGDLGPEQERPGATRVPVLVTGDRPVSSWLTPLPGTPVRFRTDGVGREADERGAVRDVEFVPFYRLHRRTYGVYWDTFTPEGWDAQRATYVAEAERLRQMEAASVAYLQPGETVFEREFNYRAGDGSVTQRMLGRPGRRGSTWFSYDLPVDPTHPMAVVATYYSGDRRATPAEFAILVDGVPVGHQVVEMREPHRFFEGVYPVPAERVRGREKVTVRFQAREGSQIATVFELRMIRADQVR